MRVVASGNLTVELIRAQRFDVTHRLDASRDPHVQIEHHKAGQNDEPQNRIDRVELSPQSLAYDPWATPMDRASHFSALMTGNESTDLQAEQTIEPERITPVVGSPALSGLGIAQVVPGTLLDVVA